MSLCIMAEKVSKNKNVLERKIFKNKNEAQNFKTEVEHESDNKVRFKKVQC